MQSAMTMEDFLCEVLPDTGYFFASRLRTGGLWWNSACTGVDQLCAKLRAYDREGEDAYFALASYREPRVWDEKSATYRKRTKPNIQALKCLWADIEIGKHDKHKPGELAKSSYADLRAALTGLIDFCAAAAIDEPTLLVRSGYGLHAYWVLQDTVDHPTWNRAAHALKALELHHGLHCDQALTANGAAVLRPPGTHNWKRDPVPVYALITPRPRLPLTFLDRLQDQADALGLIARPKASRVPLSDNLQTLVSGTEANYQPVDAEVIASKCQTLGDMRLRRGDGQPYPLWMGALTILSRTIQGDTVCHQWSQGDDRYDEAQCQAKVDEARDNLQPYTCATLRALDGNSCEGCTRTVNSPISLGLPEQRHQTLIPATATHAAQSVPKLPAPLAWCFKWTEESGLVRLIDKESDEWERACDAFPVLRYIWRDANSNEHYVRVETLIKAHDWVMSDLRLAAIGQGGQAFRRELAGIGGIVANKYEHLEWYMRTWIDHLRKTTDTLLVRQNLGWQPDNSFLLGDTLYLPDGSATTDVAIARDLYPYTRAHIPPQGADMWQYLEGIDHLYNRPKYQPYQFAWLAGFGSVLLPLLWNGPLGVPIVLWSQDSGYGKSTVAQLALIAWGDVHANGQSIHADNTTETALMTILGQRHHLPALVDETTTWPGDKLGKFAYAYASGQPKAQAKAEGGLRDNHHRRWCNIAFLTSNSSAVGQITASIRNAGARVARLFEIEVPRLGLNTDDKQIIDGLIKHHSITGHHFVSQIVGQRETVIALLRQHEHRYYQECRLDTSARFWVATAASVWVAALLMDKMGMHSFDLPRLDAWIKKKLRYLSDQAAGASEDPEDLYNELLAHVFPGLIVTDDPGSLTQAVPLAPGFSTPRGSITGRLVVRENSVWIPTSVIKEWCVKLGIDLRSFREALLAKGFLKDFNERYYLGRGTRIPSGRPTCWKLVADALADKVTDAAQNQNVIPLRKSANRA